MYRCTKCNVESKKQYIRCPRPSCNGVGTYIEFEPVPKTYSLKRTPIQSKPAIVVKDDELEQWFQSVRGKLTGYCMCGCGQKSQKDNDKFYKHSCCHLFPKRIFISVKYHLDNYLERAFFGGCHGMLDDRSIEQWVNMADWDAIRSKFIKLSPLLTEKEKATKFYAILEKLVYL